MNMFSMLYVGMLSVMDIRKKKLPLSWLIVGFIAGGIAAFVQLWQGNNTIEDIVLAMIPGICYLFLSFIARGQVGSGDGLILIVMGLMIGRNGIWFVFVAGQLMISVWAMGLLAIKKVEKNKELPYVPFLFGGMILYKAVML